MMNKYNGITVMRILGGILLNCRQKYSVKYDIYLNLIEFCWVYYLKTICQISKKP